MKVLSQEKSRVLAQQKGWSLARAEGFVEGEMFRRRGLQPSTLARVGLDEYWLGFRASFYERETSNPAEQKDQVLVAR